MKVSLSGGMPVRGLWKFGLTCPKRQGHGEDVGRGTWLLLLALPLFTS